MPGTGRTGRSRAEKEIPMHPHDHDQRRRRRRIDRRLAAVVTLVVTGVIAGAAYAEFPSQRPPNYAPTGFLVSNNRVEDISVSDFARTVNPDGARFVIFHTNRPAGYVGPWHTHPGL